MAAATNIVLVGDEIQYSFSFQALGTTTPVDPTTITVQHRTPDGVGKSYQFGRDPEVVRLSLSNYRFNIRVYQWRRHHISAFGSGSTNKQIPVFFDVPENSFDLLVPSDSEIHANVGIIGVGAEGSGAGVA